MAVADAQDKCDLILQFVEHQMRAERPHSHGPAKPVPHRTRQRELCNKAKSTCHLTGILLGLSRTEQSNAFAVDGRDVSFRSTRKVDFHDCAAFQASAIT